MLLFHFRTIPKLNWVLKFLIGYVKSPLFKSYKKIHTTSVRAESSLILCKKYFNVETNHILEPTFLLDRNDHEKLLDKMDQNNEPQLTSYILDLSDEKKQIIEIVANKLNLKNGLIGNPKSQKRDLNYLERIIPPIEEWLIGFRNAQFVVTDSFHGVAFSIIFNKPFLCIGNKKHLK